MKSNRMMVLGMIGILAGLVSTATVQADETLECAVTREVPPPVSPGPADEMFEEAGDLDSLDFSQSIASFEMPFYRSGQALGADLQSGRARGVAVTRVQQSDVEREVFVEVAWSPAYLQARPFGGLEQTDIPAVRIGMRSFVFGAGESVYEPNFQRQIRTEIERSSGVSLQGRSLLEVSTWEFSFPMSSYSRLKLGQFEVSCVSRNAR